MRSEEAEKAMKNIERVSEDVIQTRSWDFTDSFRVEDLLIIMNDLQNQIDELSGKSKEGAE